MIKRGTFAVKKQCFLCLILAFLLCFSGCVTLQFEAGNTVVSYDNTYQTQQIPAEQTDAVAEIPTQQPADHTGTATRSVPEIVAFFNNAVNTAKNNADAYTLKETVLHSVSISQINSEAMRGMAQSVIDKLNRSYETVYTVVGGVATANGVSVYANDVIPPEGAAFVLTESEVAAARAVADGQNTAIVMYLQEDTASLAHPIPAIHGVKIPYVSLNGQSVDPYTVGTAQMQYTDIVLTASVDGSGRLLNLTVSANVTGSATGGIGVMTAEVLFGGTLKETQAFTYS